MPKGTPKVQRTRIYLALDAADVQALDGLVARLAPRMGYLADEHREARDRMARAALRLGVESLIRGDAEMQSEVDEIVADVQVSPSKRK